MHITKIDFMPDQVKSVSPDKMFSAGPFQKATFDHTLLSSFQKATLKHTLIRVWNSSNYGIFQTENTLKFYGSNNLEFLNHRKITIEDEILKVEFDPFKLGSPDENRIQIGDLTYDRRLMDPDKLPHPDIQLDTYNYWWRVLAKPFTSRFG